MKSTYLNLFAIILVAFMPTALSAQVPAYVPTDGLVGWWPLNGSMTDISGNNYNGTLQGGGTATVDRFGASASAIALSNGQQSCSIPAPVSGTFTNAMSYCFWYKELSFPSIDYQTLGDINGKTLLLQPNSAVISAAGEVYGVVGSNSGLFQNGWKHIAVVYDNRTILIYVNGLIANSTSNNTQPSQIQYLNIASQLGGNVSGYPFSGSVDDFGLWNRALTQNEVSNLYNNAQTTPMQVIPEYMPMEGLVGWWPLNGNTLDYSGNGRNASVSIGAISTSDRNENPNSAYEFNLGKKCIMPPTPEGTYVNAMSYSFWFKETINPVSDYLGLFYASGKSLLMTPNPSTLSAAFSNIGAYAESEALAINDWKHVVVVYSNQQITIYINGVVSGSASVVDASVPIEYLNEISFAGAYNSENYFYSGKIDDIAMYNRALNFWEVSSLYLNEIVTAPSCVSLAANLQEGLVGYWPFCGNANDESGNGNDGAVNGATLTEDRFGNANAAYGFDGVDDWVETSTSFLQASNPHAISMWWQTIDSTKTNQTLFNTSPHTLENCAFHYSSLNPNPAYDLFYGLGSGGSGASSWNVVHPDDGLIENTPSTQGQWHHLVWSKDDQLNWTFYADGQLVETFHADINVGDQLANLRFGAENNGAINGGANFKGNLDDIAIYNRALSSEEVQELYTLDACTFTVYDTLTVENVINVYDTLTIENIVDVFDTTYINVEVYDTLTVENIVNVYDTLTIENVIDVFDTTTVVETVVVFDTLTVENVIDVFDTTTVVETVVVFDTLTIENVIDVFDTTTVVETVVVFDTLTVENVIDVYDTTFVTITDTLLIDITFVGFEGQPSWLNTVLVFPNPTNDHITIDYGNFALMAGYNTVITDAAGATVYSSTVNSQQAYIDINAWGAAGVYFMSVYDVNGVVVATRQIVLE
jgi:hypothetical protein